MCVCEAGGGGGGGANLTDWKSKGSNLCYPWFSAGKMVHFNTSHIKSVTQQFLISKVSICEDLWINKFSNFSCTQP